MGVAMTGLTNYRCHFPTMYTTWQLTGALEGTIGPLSEFQSSGPADSPGNSLHACPQGSSAPPVW